MGGATGSVGLTGVSQTGQTSRSFSSMTWMIGHRDDEAHMGNFF